MNTMKKASDGAIDEKLKYFRSGFFNIGGESLYVSRTGFTNELGHEIYCCAAETDHISLWDYLLECGTPYGIEFSSTKAMTIRRIEWGILGNVTDMAQDVTKFEAGLMPFVDMEKFDFMG